MPGLLMWILGLGLFALAYSGLWWLFRRPDYFDDLPAGDVPREPGIRGWYRTRGLRRARAQRREQLQEQAHQKALKDAYGSDDPNERPPGTFGPGGF